MNAISRPSSIVPLSSDLVTVTTAPPIPRTDIRNPSRLGWATVILGFGGFLAWATLAPLHSAVVAPGVLEPVSGRKTVKHNDGGPIAAVLVKEGDAVTAGQPLVKLDDTAARSALSAAQGQWIQASALAARLQAELNDKPGIAWPADWATSTDPRILAAKTDQQILFVTRHDQFGADIALLHEQVSSYRAQELANRAARDTYNARISISGKRLDAQRFLRTKGLERAPETAQYELQQATDQGSAAELDAKIMEIRQQTHETEAKIPKATSDRRQQIATDLVKARGDAAGYADQIRDAEGKLALRTIKAPNSGMVTGFRHLSPGAVISANEAILDIVPSDEPLLVEAHIAPKDIKELRPGLATKLVLSAYDSRVVGTVDGTVEYVSADRLTDQGTQPPQSYYAVRIKLNDERDGAVKGLPIKAGMPVEARIQVSARTPIDYIIGPLTQSYLRAFIQ